MVRAMAGMPGRWAVRLAAAGAIALAGAAGVGAGGAGGEPPAAARRVVAIEHVPDVGVVSAELENGIRVHHRQMDAGGRVELALSVSSPALRALGEGERRALAVGLAPGDERARGALEAPGVRWRAWPGAAGVLLSVSGPAESLDSLVAALASVASRPVVDADRLEAWRAKEDERGEAEAALARAMAAALGRERDRAELDHEALEAMARGAMEGATLELGAAGDVAAERVLLAAAEHLGARAKEPTGDGAGRLASAAGAAASGKAERAGVIERRIEVADEGPRTLVLALRTCGARDDLAAGRRLRMLAEVLEARLEAQLRDERQLVYEARCGYDPRATERRGALVLWFVAAPGREKIVLRRAAAMLEEVAAEAPGEGERRRAAQRWAERAEKQLADAGFWAMVLSEHRARGLGLLDVARAREAYEGMPASEVSVAAQEALEAPLVVRLIAVDRGREGGE